MGANLCGLRNTQDPDRKKNSCGGGKVNKFINLLASKKIRKAQSSRRQEKLIEPKLQQVCKNTNISKVLTLEDLIKTSPGFSKSSGNDSNNVIISGGSEHFPMPNYKQSSKKIHPSFDGDCGEEVWPPGIFSEDEAENGKSDESSLCKSSKSGKCLKKKVSFRSPEVADIFVLDSPVIYVSV